MRTSEKDRAHNILEVCNIKLSCVATDIFGVSGMAIIKELIDKTQDADPNELAQLAKGVMRKKIPDLVKALNGKMDEHNACMLQMVLDHLAFINQMIEELDQKIEEKCKPYQQEIELLDTIPGIDKVGAQAIVAEVGGTCLSLRLQKDLPHGLDLVLAITKVLVKKKYENQARKSIYKNRSM